MSILLVTSNNKKEEMTEPKRLSQKRRTATPGRDARKWMTDQMSGDRKHRVQWNHCSHASYNLPSPICIYSIFLGLSHRTPKPRGDARHRRTPMAEVGRDCRGGGGGPVVRREGGGQIPRVPKSNSDPGASFRRPPAGRRGGGTGNDPAIRFASPLGVNMAQ